MVRRESDENRARPVPYKGALLSSPPEPARAAFPSGYHSMTSSTPHRRDRFRPLCCPARIFRISHPPHRGSGLLLRTAVCRSPASPGRRHHRGCRGTGYGTKSPGRSGPENAQRARMVLASGCQEPPYPRTPVQSGDLRGRNHNTDRVPGGERPAPPGYVCPDGNDPRHGSDQEPRSHRRLLPEALRPG